MTDETDAVLETASDETPEGQPPEAGDANLTAIRDLVLRAHPDVVPELIEGETVDALIASIEPAQAAYQRLAESMVRSSRPAVPAGGQRPMPVDPDRLSASEKIRRGLAR